MNFWKLSEEELKAKGAFNTAKEIYQQPKAWQETLDLLEANKEQIESFINPLLAKENVRIIFTGAGTSAYVGDIIAPYLREKTNKDVWAIATTDIVSAPTQYLLKDVPTVLISFARSGDSPESIGAFDLAEQLVDEIYQVVITCNKNGKLAKKAEDKSDHTLVFFTPEQTNDLGFAMTSSFSSMLLSALLIFDRKDYLENIELAKKIIDFAEKVLADAKGLADIDITSFERIVFLGSGSLYGLSRETCLKVLELTAGKIAAVSEGVMGFRHGPKSIINDKTLVVIWLSSDSYTRQYEMDFLEELYHDVGDFKVMAVSAYKDETVAKLADYTFFVDENETSAWGKDAYIALDYVLFDHLLALKASMGKGVAPDTPCPSGSVNRVVKGVTLHELKEN